MRGKCIAGSDTKTLSTCCNSLWIKFKSLTCISAEEDSSNKTDIRRIITVYDSAFIEELKQKLKEKLFKFVEESEA